MKEHKDKIMNFVIVFTAVLLFFNLTRLHDLVFFKYLCICNYAISTFVVILLNYKRFFQKEYYKQNYLLFFIVLLYIIEIIYYGFNTNSIKDFIYLLYFLIVVSTLYDKKKEILSLITKYILYSGLIINILSLIFGILEALHLKFLPFSIIETIAGNVNFYGLYTNPNAFGIASLVVLVLYYSFNRNKKVFLNIGCLLLFSVSILVSGSRASLVSAIIYFIMFFIFKRYHPTKTLISKVFIIIVILFLGITSFLSFMNVKEKEFVGIEKTVNSLTTNRYMLWKYSLISIDNTDKLFLGIPSSDIGLERYKKIPDKLYFSFGNYTQNLSKSNNTHNGYIQLFISSGVICGILVLLWIYKGLKNTDDAFIPIITAILCLNMFENELVNSRSIILFLLCYLLFFNEVGIINRFFSFLWSKMIFFKNKLGIRNVKSILNKLKTTGFFSIFISSIFGKVVVFLGNILLARLLSKSDYGLYAYVFNCFAVLTLMGDFGVSSSAMQYITENLNSEKEQFKYLKYAVVLGALFSVISGILILSSPIFYPYTIAESSTIVQMFFLIPLISTLANIFAIILRAHQQNKKFAYYNFFTVFVNYALIVPLTYFIGIKGVVYATYGYYLFSLFFAIYLSRKYLKKFFYKYTIKAKEKIDFIKFSFIMQLNITMSHLLLIIDTFVIGLIISDSNTIATYKVANSIPQALAFIPTCVVIYILPYFIKHNKERKWLSANLKKIILYGGLVYGIFSLGIILFSKIIIGLLYGAQYSDAVLPFIILIIGFFFNATFTVPCSSIMQGLRKVNINLIISVISLVLNLGLNFIFINIFGFIGVAITTTLIQIITSIYYLIYLRKKVL